MIPSSNRFSLLTVTLTYVAVTVGESILAPLLPVAAGDLSISTVQASRILGVLSVGAAIGNLVGGVIFERIGSKSSSMAGVALTTVGATTATLSTGLGAFVTAQAMMGLGAGVFFAGGIYSVSRLADPSRRGSALANYGIAFSLGMAAAVGLAAMAGSGDLWRRVFGVAAGLGVVSLATLWFAHLPPPPRIGESERGGLGVLTVPVAVGAIAAVAQFGLVVFIPIIAVESWAVTASVGATILLVGRILSIPGKAVAGRLVDRLGALSAARVVGLVLFGSGLSWLLLPWTPVAMTAATVFTAAAGAMFPVANVVAADRFGGRGRLLGTFRSLQMATAAVSVWLVGVTASHLGLETALLLGVMSLLAIMTVRTRT